MAVAAPIAAPASAPAEDDAFSFGGFSARQLAVLVAMAAFLIVSVILLAPAFADLPDIWDRLTHGDARWLALARRNADTLHARLYAPADGGYAHRAWREHGQVRLDGERHTAAQAWMQYAQAALAFALA